MTQQMDYADFSHKQLLMRKEILQKQVARMEQDSGVRAAMYLQPENRDLTPQGAYYAVHDDAGGCRPKLVNCLVQTLEDLTDVRDQFGSNAILILYGSTNIYADKLGQPGDPALNVAERFRQWQKLSPDERVTHAEAENFCQRLAILNEVRNVINPKLPFALR